MPTRAAAAAPVTDEDNGATAMLLMAFGGTAFSLLGHGLEDGDTLPEAELRPIFEAIAASLGPCGS